MAKKTEGRKRYWISFDLGLRGNYDALYAWLDEHGAKECGESVATFFSDKRREAIAEELSKILGDQPNPRIYIIRLDLGGKFVLGRRKLPPWQGYHEVGVDSGEET